MLNESLVYLKIDSSSAETDVV